MPMNRTEKFYDETANKGEAFEDFKARMVEKAIAEDMGIIAFAGEDAGKGNGSCKFREVVEEWVTAES